VVVAVGAGLTMYDKPVPSGVVPQPPVYQARVVPFPPLAVKVTVGGGVDEQ
jgi:hypothetical protein